MKQQNVLKLIRFKNFKLAPSIYYLQFYNQFEQGQTKSYNESTSRVGMNH